MPLKTTVIGSYPKPEYLNLPSWIKNGKKHFDTVQEYNDIVYTNMPENIDKINQMKTAMKQVLDSQTELGIDVITDGELSRENYIYFFCRNLQGFDFENAVRATCRGGASTLRQPLVVQPITPKNGESFMDKEWLLANEMTQTALKVTVPGPMTISDTVENRYYNNSEEFSKDLVKCVNKEIIALAKAGCKYIQVDEPTLVRYPQRALDYGIEHLAKCFDGVPNDVTKAVHICCGYPDFLDQKDYVKASQDAYFKIADAIDNAGLDEISMEDAHRRNDPMLFSHFKKSKVILGVVDVVSSRVETVEEIKSHIQNVLQFIPKNRLVISPDCGLLFLTEDLIKKKLGNMVEAAKTF